MKYIDTSAFVKYYGNPEFERGIEEVEVLFGRAREGEDVLVSSILMVGETISVFDRWIRIKAITKDEFDKILGRFVMDVKELSETGALIMETISPLFITFSIEYIIKHHIPINDAVHLYTALTWMPEVDEFVCCDENLLRAARAEGLNTFNPEG
ncbi:type II toxin-antitoxin system VapC family toxin [Candidatus Pyrohabitans sp.]